MDEPFLVTLAEAAGAAGVETGAGDVTAGDAADVVGFVPLALFEPVFVDLVVLVWVVDLVFDVAADAAGVEEVTGVVELVGVEESTGALVFRLSEPAEVPAGIAEVPAEPAPAPVVSGEAAAEKPELIWAAWPA